MGRFTQVDPLWAKYPGWSPYNYALNNPLKYVDRDGRAPEEWIARFNAKLAASEAIAGYTIDAAWERGTGSPHNNAADAWRHATWSKLSSEVVGKSLTFVIGVSHEAQNIAGGTPLEEVVMDLTNNKEGRSIANTETTVEDLLESGELETIEPSNDVEYIEYELDEEKDFEDEVR